MCMVLGAMHVFFLPKMGHATPGLQFRLHGYVNAELFFDSRQMVAAREGNVPLWPMPVDPDADGNDRNGHSALTFSVLSTRLGATVSGAEMLGAKASAVVEVDFLGITPPTYNLIRLRQALVRLNWERSELLAGQYWHPMFVLSCYPGTIAFGSGPPYHVLNSGPQLRYTYKPGALSLAAAIVSQNDFTSLGPQGGSSAYIRNSGRPELLAQAIINTGSLLAGATAGVKWLRPYMVTAAGYQTKERMQGFTGNAFVGYKAGGFSAKAQFIYGNDLSHLVMPGGYGEASLTDATRGIYTYSGIRSYATWIDLEQRGNKAYAGLFAGYVQNLGSREAITGRSWGRATNIANMYRIAPRAGLLYGKVSLNAEVMYDLAAYGTPDSYFKFSQTTDADNIRLLLTVKYVF